MKRILLFLFLPLSVYAQDLQTGNTFTDGDTVNAAVLNNAVNNATILPTFLSNKGAGTPAPTDLFLFYNGGSTSLKQSSLSSLFSLGMSFNTQNALTVFAGPGTSGATATNPTWRTLTPHDTSMPTNVTVNTFIDGVTARTFSRTLSANTTFTFPNLIDGETVTVVVKQAAAGGPYTASFSGAIWRTGATPVMSTGANKQDVYTFIKVGTTIFGAASQNY